MKIKEEKVRNKEIGIKEAREILEYELKNLRRKVQKVKMEKIENPSYFNRMINPVVTEEVSKEQLLRHNKKKEKQEKHLEEEEKEQRGFKKDYRKVNERKPQRS